MSTRHGGRRCWRACRGAGGCSARTAAFNSGVRQMLDQTHSSHRVAAVVPTWNEVASVGAVVSGLRQAGACCVFVVDAGSTDGTPEAVRAAGGLVVEETRRGYGRACLTGAEAARGHELIAFLDGDGSCAPADLPRLGAAAEAADLVPR